MSSRSNVISLILVDLHKQLRWDSGVVGSLIFGSFVKGGMCDSSDLDLLVLRNDIEEHSRIVERRRGVPVEMYQWPSRRLKGVLTGDGGDVFSGTFLFEVLRTGRDFYDPHNLIKEYQAYARTHNTPPRYMRSLANRVRESLYRCQRNLRKGEILVAELELRRASEEVARLTLLGRGVLEINPPKNYLPHLRRLDPAFYTIFRDIHNFEKLDKDYLKSSLQAVRDWCERAGEWASGLKEGQGSARKVDSARTELLNAIKCFKGGDLEAVIMELRYSALFLAPPTLRLQERVSSDRPSSDVKKLVDSKSPYGDVVRQIMTLTGDVGRLRRQFKSLSEFAGEVLERASRSGKRLEP